MTTTTTGHRVPMTRHVVPGITHGIKTGYTVRGYPCSTGAPENCQHLGLCGETCCGPWNDDNEEDDE